MRSKRKLFWPTVEFGTRHLYVLAFLSVLATQSRTVLAQSNAWTRIGPDPAKITSVAVDPQTPSTIYAANGAANTSIRLLGTTNGESWEIRDWRKTNGDGNWSEESTFPMGTEGEHFIRVEINRTVSNVVSFVVSNCGP